MRITVPAVRINICRRMSCLNIDVIKGITVIRNIRIIVKRIMSLKIPLFSIISTWYIWSRGSDIFNRAIMVLPYRLFLNTSTRVA